MSQLTNGDFLSVDPSQNFLSQGGELYYFPNIFSEDQAAHLFGELRDSTQWEHSFIRIFGKEIPEPRLSAWYGDPEALYTYSGVSRKPFAWNEPLLKIKQRTEEISGAKYNSVLLNYYRDGKDSMGWHRDNEPELEKEPTIASLSFGAKRRFLVREYKSKNKPLEFLPENGSLLLMKGRMQEFWEHSVPKSVKEVGPRINLTFRWIN